MATNYVILYWYTVYFPFLCFKQEPIHTICFKNTLLATEHCRSCQHHLGSQGFEICTSFYAGSSRALDLRTWWNKCIDAVAVMYYYQFSWLGTGGIVVSFQGLFTIGTGYEICMISWRLAIQLLQQLSTCTQALVPFRYRIWIFLQFWKPFVMCFVALNFESFKFSGFFWFKLYHPQEVS